MHAYNSCLCFLKTYMYQIIYSTNIFWAPINATFYSRCWGYNHEQAKPLFLWSVHFWNEEGWASFCMFKIDLYFFFCELLILLAHFSLGMLNLTNFQLFYNISLLAFCMWYELKIFFPDLSKGKIILRKTCNSYHIAGNYHIILTTICSLKKNISELEKCRY